MIVSKKEKFISKSIHFSDVKNCAVCLYKLTRNPIYGVFHQDHLLLTCDTVGGLSKVENGYARGKQTMLYLKHVAIFRSKLCLNKGVSDTVRTLFLYHNFMKMICFLSK